jgi:serine protease Do
VNSGDGRGDVGNFCNLFVMLAHKEGEAMELSETYKIVRPACVAIALKKEVEGGKLEFITFGSGVCVDKSGIIVTAKHVVTGYYEQIKGEKTSTTSATSEPDFFILFVRMGAERYEVFYSKPMAIMFDAENDVAIMKVQEIDGGWPCIDIPTSWKTQEGDAIATAGFPLRGWHDKSIFPNLFSGIVSQVTAQYLDDKGWKIQLLILDVSVHPGNSGGPVFNARTGELLGIVSSQRLRTLNVNKQLAGTNDFSIQTWTNIVECVPWTSFAFGIEKIKKQLKKTN